MNSVTYLLASRYLSNSTQQQTIWRMMLISFISIFIGSFSLTLVTAIMNGFEHTVHQKMQNIHPAATIYTPMPIAVDAVQRVIKNEFPETTNCIYRAHIFNYSTLKTYTDKINFYPVAVRVEEVI